MKNEKIKMKNGKAKIYALYFSLFTIHYSLLLSSCKKQELPYPGSAMQTVKVYSDTSISLPNQIAAGNNRLLMTYSTYNYQTYVSGSAITVTDNKGELIWNKRFSNDTLLCNALVQPNGNYAFTGLGGQITIAILEEDGTLINQFITDPSGNSISKHQFQLPFRATCPIVFPTTTISSLSGNNLIMGTYNDVQYDSYDRYKGFVMECDNNGNLLWANRYYFPQYLNGNKANEATQLTDGVITPDGGYLFCGYWGGTAVASTFFLMKTDSKGDSLWTKFYFTGKYDTVGGEIKVSPYAAGTSSIVPLNNGNYMLFTGPSPEGSSPSVNSSAWIYLISSSGDSLASTQINYLPVNYPCMAAKKADGSVFSLMNLNNALLYYTTFAQQNTAFAVVNPDLITQSVGYFQTRYTDFFQSLCLTSDGNIACFGMIQSSGKYFYKPELIILN